MSSWTKRLVWLLAAGAMTATSIAVPAPAAAQTKWDYSLFTGVTHPITLRLKGFTEEVAKRTNGKLIITARPAGELPFKATEMVKAVSGNQATMGQAYQGWISGAIPISSIAALPFLVRTVDELKLVWPIIDKYTKPEFEKNGVMNLFYFSWPPQNVFGKGAPIISLSDFKGRKIRTTDGKQAEMMKRLGGSAVTVVLAEVPVAMERGVTEGFFTAAFNVIGAKWYEFINWGWLGNVHIGGPDYQIVNLAEYKKLAPDVRAALDAVAAEWGPKMIAENMADETRDMEALKTTHKVAMHIPSQADIDELARQMSEYWETWAKSQGPNTEAMLKEIRAALKR